MRLIAFQDTRPSLAQARVLKRGEDMAASIIRSQEAGSESMTVRLQSIRTLEFNDLRAGDIILIRTRNNLYTFQIGNERTLCGRLLGEVNKTHFPEAVLIGAVIGRRGRPHTLTSRLVTESRALFAVHQGNEVIRLTTSTVVSLGCVRPF